MKQSDLAIDRNGDILVLVTTDEEPFFILTRCTSRGELPVVVEIADLLKGTEGGASFKPAAICCQDGLVFLMDNETSSFVAIDDAGHCLGPVTSLDKCATTLVVEGKKVACPTKSSFRTFLLKKVYRALGRMAPRITKTSSSCNETDPAKTPYSRNGLWIGRYEN